MELHQLKEGLEPLPMRARVRTPSGQGRVVDVRRDTYEILLDTGNLKVFDRFRLIRLDDDVGVNLIPSEIVLTGVGGPATLGANERKGKYMRTFTGKRYWPMDPRVEEVDILDIAHHLSNKCRYAGATMDFYSVAEHQVYVALDLALQGEPIEIVRTGALHDGSEAYNGDLIRPLKYDPAFSAPFKHVEDLNEKVIAEKFGLTYPWHPAVKKSDEAVTAAELRQIMNRTPEDRQTWADDKLHDDSRVAPFDIVCLAPPQAKALYLALWERLERGECPRTISKAHHFLVGRGA